MTRFGFPGSSLTTVVLLAALHGPPSLNRWFGADKVKHFLMSALVHSTVYSSARALRADRSVSQVIGAAAVVGVGVTKEIHDRRSGKPFSVEDLTWDVGGGVAAAALLNGSRDPR